MNKVRQNVVSIAPPIDRNVIWIDISGAEPVQKIFLEGEWKTFKDADVDAEFATHQKVSDISLVTGTQTANNTKLPTVAKVNDILSEGYHERAKYVGAEIESGVATIEYNRSGNINYIVGNTADTIVLVKAADINTNDSVITIRFTSGATAMTLQYTAADLLWANDEVPTIEANTEYILAIWNCIAVLSKLVANS